MAHFLKNDRRTTKSTRIQAAAENRERAQALADTWEKAAAMAGEGRDGRQWVLATLNEMFGEVGLPQVVREVETWDTVSAGWLAGCTSRRGITAGTLADYRRAVASFGEFLGARRKQDITTISTREVDRYVAALLKRGSPSTAALRLKQVRICFNWAIKQEIITRNPATSVEIPMGKGLTRSPFPAEEILILLQQARQEADAGDPLARERLTHFLLGLCTGARIHDCATMRWSDIDLKTGRLAYLPQKKARSGQVLTVELVDPLLSHLRSLRQKGEFLCPTLAKLPTGRLSKHFAGLLERAGIAGVRTTEGRARAFNDKSFHALRHTLASLLAEAGVDDLVRRRITGHEDKAVAAIYQHVSVESTGRALNQVLAPFQEPR